MSRYSSYTKDFVLILFWVGFMGVVFAVAGNQQRKQREKIDEVTIVFEKQLELQREIFEYLKEQDK